MKKILLILLLGMFMVSLGSAALTDDIVSYYKLDEAGGSVIDSLGINNGVNNGATPNVAGKINTAYDFESTETDDINISDVSLGTGEITISAWVKRESSSDGAIVGKTKNISDTEYVLRILADDTVFFKIENDNTFDEAQTVATVSTGSFVFIVATYNATSQKIYIDGVERASNVPTTTMPNLANDAFIGQSGDNNNYMDGVIDEVGIWNRTLNQSEITSLFNLGNGLSYPFTETGVDVSVSLILPLNDTLVSSNVTFNVSITPEAGFNLTNATLFVWDSDGNIFTSETNIITGNSTNTTSFVVTNLTSDDYEWNVFGQASNGSISVGNFSISNNTFIWVPFNVNSESFNDIVFETSRQEFILNITTLPSVLSVDAILNYNGTRFTADTLCSSGICIISTAIDVPLVSAGESENKSFLWEISIFDGTNSFSTNITQNQQNVTRLHLEKCDGTFTVQTLNFTAFDESTELFVNPFVFDGTFGFWMGTGTVVRNNSISESSVASLQLCLTPETETFYLDATIEYNEASGSNYTTRNYFFQNDTISNISQNIELGLLLSEDSTSFILRVQDRDILPVSNVIILTQRFYPGDGTFRTVQVSQTDENGATIGFFNTETVDYRFVLKRFGSTVLTTNKQKIVGDSVPFTLTFTIGDDEGAAWEPFEEIDDLDSDLNFNKTSNIASFTYLDTSGTFTLGRLIVEKVNASGLQNTVICSETSTQSSATITCNVTGESTGQYIMRGIITRSGASTLVKQEPFALEDFSMIAGRLGLFLGWFIILISVFAFKFNEVAGIILVNIAMIFVNMIGLIAFGYVFISAMIAISIIILVVLER